MDIHRLNLTFSKYFDCEIFFVAAHGAGVGGYIERRRCFLQNLINIFTRFQNIQAGFHSITIKYFNDLNIKLDVKPFSSVLLQMPGT